jgi:ABC-2 type transport system ATP-binding protein
MLAAANRIPDSRVDEVLEIVGLSDVKKNKPKGFSLGMAQRLGLAQALLGDPKVLILDEPANGLDPHGIHWLRDVLKSLAAQGRTVFVSSHLLAEMALMADELVVIGRGKMIYNGAMSDFVQTFTKQNVVVRTPAAKTFADALRREGAEVETRPDGSLLISGLETPAVGELAYREGVMLHELATHSASLEQAFISATGASEDYIARDVAEVLGGAPTTDGRSDADETPGGAA